MYYCYHLNCILRALRQAAVIGHYSKGLYTIHGVKYARMRVFSDPYVSVREYTREKPYSGIFYAVIFPISHRCFQLILSCYLLHSLHHLYIDFCAVKIIQHLKRYCKNPCKGWKVKNHQLNFTDQSKNLLYLGKGDVKFCNFLVQTHN